MTAGMTRRGLLAGAVGAGVLSGGLGLPAVARAPWPQGPRAGGDPAPLQVAAVLAGRPEDGDGAGWGSRSGAVMRALDAALAAGVLRGGAVLRVDHDGVGDAIDRLAGEGAGLVIADVSGAEQASRAAAAAHPRTAFLFASSFTVSPDSPNVAVFDRRIEAACHLSGVVAGAVTRSGRIGVVAGHPLHGVNRLLHAFAAGARAVRPGAVFDLAFTGADPDGAGSCRAARAMIAAGADVILGERPGAVRAAASVPGIVALGCGTGPGGPPGSAWWTLGPTLDAARDWALRGSGAADLSSWSGLAEGGCGLVPPGALSDRMDAPSRRLLAERTEGLVSGRFILGVPDHQPDAAMT